MKKRRITRLLAAALTASLTLTAVVGAGAAGYVGDISGDGRITAFDAQLLAEANADKRTLTDVQRKAAGDSTVERILAYIFGDTAVDVGDLDGDGVYEIYNAAGLQHMAKNPTGSYILEADLDLGGADWTPIQYFAGSFDGNGHTISNLTITQAVPSSSAATEYDQGFFGSTMQGSVVKSLELRNVKLISAANAKYIGLAVGTARGTVENCTVTGSVTDTRTNLNNKKIFTGVLVGRTTDTALTISGGSSVSVTDDTGTYTVTGLCADVMLYIEDSETVVNNGLIGYQHANSAVTGLWRDNTNNASNESEVMRARQDEVVSYMEAMATVEWTVSETMTMDAGSGSVHTQVFEPGVTYYGLPYNHRNGGLERFLYCMDTVNGVNVATTRYGTYSNKDNPGGFMLYMGNDCSSAVGWAWMQVSPNRVASSSTTECAGGALVVNTSYMIPTDTEVKEPVVDENGDPVLNEDGTQKMTTVVFDNQTQKGIYPVGDWTTNTILSSDGRYYYDDIVGEFAYDAPLGPNSRDFLTLNGDEVLGEAYAVARKADAVVCGDPAGHARLLSAYPVVIRNADGSLDMDQSFLVCTEQGDGLYDATNTSWRIDHRWSFNNLLGYKDATLPTGYKYSKDVYLPITIRALRSEYVKYAYIDEANKVTGPAEGLIYSNWRIVSSTVIVQDTKGKELFRNTVYTGLADANRDADGIQTYDYNHGNCEYVLLSRAHGEAYKTFAAEKLTDGQTYRYSVQVLLANGETLIISRDSLKVNTNGHSGTEFDDFVYTAE